MEKLGEIPHMIHDRLDIAFIQLAFENGDLVNDAVEKRSCSEITQTHSTPSTLVSKLYDLIIPNSIYPLKLKP